MCVLHFVYTGEEKAKEQFATPILLLDDWMTVRWRCDPRLLRVARPLCNRIGVVFASTSTHARTYTRVTSIEAWSTNYYVSLVSTDLFFFFHAPSSSFRTPQWIVQFTVPIWPWITLLPSYTNTWKQLLLKLSRAFRCFFSPMTWLWTILPYSTLHSPVFIYFSFFFSLPSSLPFFFRRKTNSIFDYICSGYVVTRYNHLTARSKPFLRGI